METINIIIETPKGSTEKYDYDKDSGFFKLKKILPAGMIFPYDFGFIPKTKGEDGDPLDIIVINEFRSFPGIMIECRIIGAIIAEQTEKGNTVRNDRFIGIPIQSKTFEKIKSAEDLPKILMDELQEFFITYNELSGKKFKPLKILNSKDAFKLIKK
ncbi:MAG: inorganic diphosphatase [Chitinophagaceae bacterium]